MMFLNFNCSFLSFLSCVYLVTHFKVCSTMMCSTDCLGWTALTSIKLQDLSLLLPNINFLCMFFSEGDVIKCLFILLRHRLMVDQRKDSTQVQDGEPMGVLRLLTLAWVTQRQLHHQPWHGL